MKINFSPVAVMALQNVEALEKHKCLTIAYSEEVSLYCLVQIQKVTEIDKN